MLSFFVRDRSFTMQVLVYKSTGNSKGLGPRLQRTPQQKNAIRERIVEKLALEEDRADLY